LRRLWRHLARGAAFGGALGAISAAAIGFWLWSSLPPEEGSETVVGIAAPVEIHRDGWGIPRIEAKSVDDAYFGLGYVHAQDRLWQMEGTRRLGQGRLAELVGERGLASDKFMRLLGLYRLAERQAETAPPEVKAALQAYAAGVNAWIDGHPGSLPPEYALLRFKPEAWRPADSLVWIKLMATRLSGNWREELLRARMLKVLSPDQVTALWPPYPDSAPSTLSLSTAALAPAAGGRPMDFAGLRPLLDAVAAADPEPPLPQGESNGWVLSGEHTASGKPILANDPHLAFSAPILWYLARLEAPGFSVAGATVPAMPFHIVGHNDRIAWGMTSVGTDMEDLFVEKVDPNDGDRYLTPDGSQPFGKREEKILVRDEPEVILTVRSTHHGPVLSDLLAVDQDEGTVLALQTVYMDQSTPDETPAGLLGVNRATDWASFTAALRHIGAPEQNILYADREGNIGYAAPGNVPVRGSGKGLIPSPGWDGKGDWKGYLPFDSLPLAYNPAAGEIVNANNRVWSGPNLPFLTEDWASPQRAERILELLAAKPSQSPESSAAIQLDRQSLLARQLLPAMMAGVEPTSDVQRQVLSMLKAWDGQMTRDRPEPLIFTAWLRAFGRAVYGDDLGDLVEDYWGLRNDFLATVLDGSAAAWCDDKTTPEAESCATIAGRALGKAVDDLTTRLGKDPMAWHWGDLHRAAFRNALLTGLPLLGKLADLSIPTDGADDTVNRGSTSLQGPRPYDHIHGAGLRAVFDLSDLERSRFMIATGQSGNFVSGHYRDMLTPWRDGQSVTLGLKPEDGREKVLRLAPAGR
jgi:penicillin amidase